MKTAFVILFVILMLGSAAIAQNRTVYTSTRTSDCKQKRTGNEAHADYVGVCRGVGGYKLEVIEGDLRQTINVISPAGKRSRLDFTRFFASFSYIGEKLEWRTKRGVPVALISRYYVDDPETGKQSRSVLFVTKISPKGSCVVDIVEEVTKQNERAREVADAAGSKPCKVAE